MGVFFSSFSSDETSVRNYQRKYHHQLEKIDNTMLDISFYIRINRYLKHLLSLPIVWNIFCHLLPQYKLIVNEFDLNYRLVNNGYQISIEIISNDKLLLFFPNDDYVMRSHDDLLRMIDKRNIIFETLQKSIDIAIKYISEKRDLNSLALSSKDFIDIEPKPRRSPLRLWKDIERTETAKDEALNIFAHHYYPKVIKNMGKEIGIPIELDIDKNREKSEIRKMNLLFKDQIRNSKLARYPDTILQ